MSQSTLPPTAALADPPTTDAPAEKRYHVGTLTYTRSMLVHVFFWMLWGDLCLNVMESAVPRMVPLQLQSLGASNAVIGILTGSIFSLMNWVTNPIISTWSDRHRSRLGRRMPFLLYPTPFLAFFLILVGFSLNLSNFIGVTFPGVGHAIAHTAAALLPDVRTLPGAAQLAIGVIAVMLILYKFFDQFPQCVYYYVFADVIPQEVMGTFVCLFRVMATLGGVIFHYWLLDAADHHPQAVYLGCGLLYLAAFVPLSLVVKEGSYPPPPPKARDLGKTIRRWIKDSFSIPFYWRYFICYACFRWAFVPFNLFLIVYAQKSLEMTAGDFGHLMALVMAIQLPVLFLLGPVLDHFHPIRVGIVGYVTLILAGAAGFFFIHGRSSFLGLIIFTFIAITIFQAAIATLGPRLLPRAKYGQFCSAAMMVVETGMFFLAWACGKLLDTAGDRYLYVWLAAFSGLGLLANVILFRAWKRHGGDEHYVAPGDFESSP